MPLISPYQSGHYGLGDHFAKKVQRPERRKVSSLNLCFVLVGVLVPWALFIVNYAAMSFSIHHYRSGVWTWIIFALFTAVIVIFSAMGLRSFMSQTRDSTWFFLLSGMMIVALVGSTYFGCANFRENLEPYYDTISLNSYENLDPSTSSGQQVMDAAMITFKNDVAPNLKGSMSFRNRDTYCAAPITNTNETSLSGEYNFWAVGINCCSNRHVDFDCGSFSNAQAHSGLRMKSEHSDFFRLVVQQAEAAYHIKAPKPFFVLWTEDPVATLDIWHENGVRYYALGVFVHLVVQVLFSAIISIAFICKIL